MKFEKNNLMKKSTKQNLNNKTFSILPRKNMLIQFSKFHSQKRRILKAILSNTVCTTDIDKLNVVFWS